MLDRYVDFTFSPTSFQFAKGGIWENAWSFSVDRLPSGHELVTYLARGNEVAFEAFFGRAFFGARITGSPLDVETFSLKCLEAARAQASFFPAFQREFGFPVLGQLPTFAEIGCINAWRSVGALCIPHLPLASADFDQLLSSLRGSPVGHNTCHDKAIEFAFEHPLAHWFGVPVSIPGGSNLVSEDLLRQALRL